MGLTGFVKSSRLIRWGHMTLGFPNWKTQAEWFSRFCMK